MLTLKSIKVCDVTMLVKVPMLQSKTEGDDEEAAMAAIVG